MRKRRDSLQYTYHWVSKNYYWHYFQCWMSFLSDWSFLFYLTRNTLATKSRTLLELKPKSVWWGSFAIVKQKYISIYVSNCRYKAIEKYWNFKFYLNLRCNRNIQYSSEIHIWSGNLLLMQKQKNQEDFLRFHCFLLMQARCTK